MTLIIDTSIWLATFRDKSGEVAARIRSVTRDEQIVMALPIRLELLQGCRGEAEWKGMVVRLGAFETLSMPNALWDDAARTYFDLRQVGQTVRSSLDCLIAIIAIDHDCTLLHNDRDFEKIATVRPLKQRRLAGLEPGA